MKVTEVELDLVEDKGRMKAVSSVVVDNEFVIHDVKVIQGDENLFIAFPSRKTKEGQYADICHPINQATRTKIQDAVLEAYDKVLAESSEVAEEE